MLGDYLIEKNGKLEIDVAALSVALGSPFLATLVKDKMDGYLTAHGNNYSNSRVRVNVEATEEVGGRVMFLLGTACYYVRIWVYPLEDKTTIELDRSFMPIGIVIKFHDLFDSV